MLNTGIANLSNRFLLTIPYFNANKDSIVEIAAGETRPMYFDIISNHYFGVHETTGRGVYFTLKQAGVYRISVHVTSLFLPFQLSLKDSGDTVEYIAASAYSQMPLEIIFYNDIPNRYFFLQIKNISETNTALYRDPRYCWALIEYLV